MLDDDDDDDVSDSSNEGGVPLKINEEYAARFKHNAERTERMKRQCTISQFQLQLTPESRREI